jgi:hypothetical protein
VKEWGEDCFGMVHKLTLLCGTFSFLFWLLRIFLLLLLLSSSSSPPLLLDSQVEIQWGRQNTWYPGFVVAFKDNQHSIKYNNGEVEWITLYENYDNGVEWQL